MTTTTLTAPRLVATVQPQFWDARDYAHDAGPALHVDVTDAYEKLTPSEQAAVTDNSDASDNLYLDSTPEPEQHRGPFYVHVEAALADYLEAKGASLAA